MERDARSRQSWVLVFHCTCNTLYENSIANEVRYINSDMTWIFLGPERKITPAAMLEPMLVKSSLPSGKQYRNLLLALTRKGLRLEMGTVDSIT